ncbi:organic cation transporter protein isoform X1 [Zerene cesonia]|uniref:organic cation transporter protein isoform X1 n=1 Tax=Zerene cesonia TaxID=33412 RepID=UPI0018E53C40|nr:organic cation transporter protein isoform X1 [Zerene cesonia]
MDKEHALEEMMGKLGDFGKYQAFQFFLHILAAMTAGLHMLSLVTVAAVPDHRCWIEGVDIEESVAQWNSTEILRAIPLSPSGRLDQCLMFSEGNATIPCSKWVYDATYRSSSRGIEWNLVCDQRYKGALAQSFYMLGVFTGAIYLGGLSDRIGRKPVFCWSGILQLLLGVLVAFMPDYWSFAVVTYLYGIFGSAGAFIPAYVLLTEFIGPSKRTQCATIFHCMFSIGMICVALWGAFIDNKTILQVVYGLHSIILIPHIWLMDESPRWLWAQGKTKEAVNIVQKALKFNNSEEVLDVAEYVARAKIEFNNKLQREPEVANKTGVLDLFKTPHIRKMTMIICLCWFANSLVYYGLALNSGRTEGNPYLITAIFALVDIPSYVVVFYFLNVWGRRTFISTAMLVGGFACVVAAFRPVSVMVTTIIVVAGKLCIAASFAIAYIYCAELFPTVVRNSALGLASMFARLSGSLTPFISLLESFDPKVPSIIFGVVALLSGFLCLFLPETMHRTLPQSIADGERHGKGDTCFSQCFKNKARSQKEEDEEATISMVAKDKDSKIA